MLTTLLFCFPVTGKLQRQAISAAASSGVSLQSRLFYVTDATTKQQFLIDTGAEVSVLPPRPTDRTHRQGYDLQAANSSKIATYGTRSLTLNSVFDVLSPGFLPSLM